jgi:predicted metal-dependent peptidase
MTDPKLEQDALRVVEGARAIVKKHAEYLQVEIDALSIVFVDTGGSDSVAMDEKRVVYVDPRYLVNVGPEVFAADLVHEVIAHGMGEHWTRFNEMGIPEEHRKLWNYAGDAAGNGTCFEIFAHSGGKMKPHGHAVTPQNVMEIRKKSGWVLPESFGFADGGTVEEYYRDLLAQIEKQQPPPPPPPNGGSGHSPEGQQQQQQQQQQQSGGGGEQGEQKDGENDSGRGGAGEPKMKDGTKPKQCGGCAGDKQQTDKLREMAKAQGEQVPEGRSEIEQQANAQRTAMAIKKAAEGQGQGRGTMPAGLTRWAEKRLKPPKIDWRKQLRSIVAAGVGRAKGQQDFTQAKLRKRGAMLMPTMFAPTPRIAMVIDTSGSMSDKDLARCLSEAKGIFAVLQQGGASEVAIAACDTRATKPKKFKRWDQNAVSGVLVGGGGTDMGAGLTAVAESKPHITVVTTDGDTGWPHKQPAGTGKVVICLTRPTHCPTPSWATVVKAYEKQD